jgi:hypothetical protein
MLPRGKTNDVTDKVYALEIPKSPNMWEYIYVECVQRDANCECE